MILHNKIPDKLLKAAVGLAAFLMPFFTGFLGLMPLDQSIIFEAAGRICRGDLPYTDFGIPYGLVPALIQALLFKLAGINWTAYILHAAIFNGLFAIILFDLLKLLLPGTRRIPIAGSILASWAFYPMFGTAFMDNHSFFLGISAWWICIRSFRTKRYQSLLYCCPLLVLGFYSKPLPVIFWIFPLLMEIILQWKESIKQVKWLGGSIVFGVAFALLPFLLFDKQQFWYYTFELPFHIGQGRLGFGALKHVVLTLSLNYWIWIPFLFPLLFFIWRFGIPKSKTDLHQWIRLMVILLITIFSAGITDNAFNNITAPVFMLAFFVFHSMNRFHLIHTSKNAKYPRLIIILLIYFTGYISIYNFNRRVHDIDFTSADLKKYSPQLGLFLKTQPDIYSVNHIGRLYTLMQTNKCLYVGDLMFMYSLTGQKNPWPLIHIHDGTSYSSGDETAYAKMKLRLLQNIHDTPVGLIVEDVTWHKKQQLIADIQPLKGRLTESFGSIKVFELDKNRTEQMLRMLKRKAEK